MNFLTYFFFIVTLSGSWAYYQKWCLKTVTKYKTGFQYRTRLEWFQRKCGFLYMSRCEYSKPVGYNTIVSFTEVDYINDCCSGFRKINGYCEPICNIACPDNSYCFEPNTCACNSGYKNIGLDQIQCAPTCSVDCPINGYCKQPEVCACNSNYVSELSSIDNKTICSPICVNGCQSNSYCQEPNVCACNVGFRLTADEFCEPICMPACTDHSFCSAPNVCKCLDGYNRLENDDIGECLPFCTNACPEHSSCVRPDICECIDGYKMNDNGTKCEPICYDGCPEFSACVRPHECLCKDGYKLKNETGILVHCEAICEQDCSYNGKCIEPNVCACFSGFEMQTTTDPNLPLCQPKCSHDCQNGICFAPETCVCNPGYLMGPDYKCEPLCSYGCENGRCTEPEICVCNEGYRLDDASISKCTPICEPECINSNCVAPNSCLCYTDYIPKNWMDELSTISTIYQLDHECIPVCTPNCVNAICTAPGICQCQDGYELGESNNYECVPKCMQCINGDCIAPDICKCWTGYVNYNGIECMPITTSITTTTEDFFLTSATIEETSFTSPTEYNENSTLSPTTEYDRTTPSSYSNLSSEQCNENCKCWELYNETSTLNIVKCEHICMDSHDKPCIDLYDCTCNLHTTHINKMHLLCEDGQNSVENDEIILVCRITVGKENINVTAFKSKAVETETSKLNPWLLIISIILGSITIIGLIYLITLFYKKQIAHPDTYEVAYHT